MFHLHCNLVCESATSLAAYLTLYLETRLEVYLAIQLQIYLVDLSGKPIWRIYLVDLSGESTMAFGLFFEEWPLLKKFSTESSVSAPISPTHLLAERRIHFGKLLAIVRLLYGTFVLNQPRIQYKCTKQLLPE